MKKVKGPTATTANCFSDVPTGYERAAKLAFEFLVLTATRWNEVRGAGWAEVDRTDRVWVIPATRKKAKSEHRVSLCGRAMEILNAA